MPEKTKQIISSHILIFTIAFPIHKTNKDETLTFHDSLWSHLVDVVQNHKTVFINNTQHMAFRISCKSK